MGPPADEAEEGGYEGPCSTDAEESGGHSVWHHCGLLLWGSGTLPSAVCERACLHVDVCTFAPAIIPCASVLVGRAGPHDGANEGVLCARCPETGRYKQDSFSVCTECTQAVAVALLKSLAILAGIVIVGFLIWKARAMIARAVLRYCYMQLCGEGAVTWRGRM